MSLFFALIGRRDFFGFGCTIFALADCIFSTFLFFILFSRTIPILPKGTSYQSLSKVQLRPHSLFTTNCFFFFYLYHCYYIVKSVKFLSPRPLRLLVSLKHSGQTQSVRKKGPFFVSRALISSAKFQGKHKEKWLLCGFQTSRLIGSCGCSSGNLVMRNQRKSEKKPDVRASRGILGVILHSQSSTRRANID